MCFLLCQEILYFNWLVNWLGPMVWIGALGVYTPGSPNSTHKNMPDRLDKSCSASAEARLKILQYSKRNLLYFGFYQVCYIWLFVLCWFHDLDLLFLFLGNSEAEVHVKQTYISLQLHVQNRRRKWNFPLNFQNDIIWISPFPLNICNGIIWGGAFSKAFRSSEALISVLSKNACLYDNI